MNLPIAAAAVLAGLLLAGCSGQILVSPYPPATIAADYAAGKAVHGVLAYRTRPLTEVDRLTSRGASAACQPTLQRKQVAVLDRDHPYLVSYKGGLLESYTMGVTMNADGVLLGVNSQSTPSQGTPATAAVAVGTAAAPLLLGTRLGARVAPGQLPALPACTGGAQFVGYEQPAPIAAPPPYGFRMP